MNNRAKIICMCGSLKYTSILMTETERLTLLGYNVISVIYETKSPNEYTENDIEKFVKLHFEKIDLADAIYVVNVNGYIGSGTKRDIDYARSKGKEILYMENVYQKTV